MLSCISLLQRNNFFLAVNAINLFFWLIRDPADLIHRSRLGLLLSRRAGINYLGYGQTHLQIRTVGRNRHRKYVIVRLEGGAA